MLNAAEARMRQNRRELLYSEDEIPEIKDPAVKEELDSVLKEIEVAVQKNRDYCRVSNKLLPGTAAFLYFLGYSVEYTIETPWDEKQLMVYVKW